MLVEKCRTPAAGEKSCSFCSLAAMMSADRSAFDADGCSLPARQTPGPAPVHRAGQSGDTSALKLREDSRFELWKAWPLCGPERIQRAPAARRPGCAAGSFCASRAFLSLRSPALEDARADSGELPRPGGGAGRSPARPPSEAVISDRSDPMKSQLYAQVGRRGSFLAPVLAWVEHAMGHRERGPRRRSTLLPAITRSRRNTSYTSHDAHDGSRYEHQGTRLRPLIDWRDITHRSGCSLCKAPGCLVPPLTTLSHPPRCQRWKTPSLMQ
jgi:hypothetical protein